MPFSQGYNPSTKMLEIVTTANQDPLLTHAPIIGVDIWEHAFYLQYFNVKPEVCHSSLLPPEFISFLPKYLKAIWNVINFDEAERRLHEAMSGSKL
jgi:superoxide dismutase, Fe-Mn family